MKITTSRIKEIIREELSRMNEVREIERIYVDLPLSVDLFRRHGVAVWSGRQEDTEWANKATAKIQDALRAQLGDEIQIADFDYGGDITFIGEPVETEEGTFQAVVGLEDGRQVRVGLQDMKKAGSGGGGGDNEDLRIFRRRKAKQTFGEAAHKGHYQENKEK